MYLRVAWHVEHGIEAFGGSVVRYGLLERASRAAAERGATLLAFGMTPGEVRLVFEGSADAVRNAARGAKVGTTRAVLARGATLVFGPTRRERVHDLVEAVTWAHRAPLEAGATGPLASPWSSHRDLLGWREAAFFDASPLRARVEAAAVHERVGGGDLPRARKPDGHREPLTLLLRVAAALRGVLPADRRCFGLFCQLARARGWRTMEVADALMLTDRRVRQLYQVADPLVPVALGTLADPRLCRVP